MTSEQKSKILAIAEFDRVKDGAEASHIYMAWTANPSAVTVRDWEWFVNGANWRNVKLQPLIRTLVEMVERSEAALRRNADEWEVVKDHISENFVAWKMTNKALTANRDELMRILGEK